MSERVTAAQAARLLDGADRILILTHQFPDGDTLGSGFALCLALRKLGKTVRVACSDPIPEKYEYMTAHIPMPAFEPAYVCAVDVADVKLLGGLSVYGWTCVSTTMAPTWNTRKVSCWTQAAPPPPC